MNKIQETLGDLRRAPGVKGTALVTSDGLMVASALDSVASEDVVAGLTSFLLMTTTRCLQENGMDALTGYTLHATHGKAVFVDVQNSFLVVLMDQFADVEACRGEIGAAALQLRRCSRVG